MKNIMEQNTKDLRTWAKILLLDGCPLEETVTNCPLNGIIELSSDGRMTKLNQMSNADLEEIIAHHQNCIEQPTNQRADFYRITIWNNNN